MAQHGHELVLGSIGGVHASEMQRQDLLVLAPESLAHPQQHLERDIRVRVGQRPHAVASDLQDDTALTGAHGRGARPSFEEPHLAERLPRHHAREHDGLIAAGGEHGFG